MFYRQYRYAMRYVKNIWIVYKKANSPKENFRNLYRKYCLIFIRGYDIMTTIKFKKRRIYMDCKTGILNLSYDITFQDVSIIVKKHESKSFFYKSLRRIDYEWKRSIFGFGERRNQNCRRKFTDFGTKQYLWHTCRRGEFFLYNNGLSCNADQYFSDNENPGTYCFRECFGME